MLKFCVLICLFVQIQTTKPRSINLELETIIEFQNKDSSDIQFIDNIQNFLRNIKNEITNKNLARRQFRKESRNIDNKENKSKGHQVERIKFIPNKKLNFIRTKNKVSTNNFLKPKEKGDKLKIFKDTVDLNSKGEENTSLKLMKVKEMIDTEINAPASDLTNKIKSNKKQIKIKHNKNKTLKYKNKFVKDDKSKSKLHKEVFDYGDYKIINKNTDDNKINDAKLPSVNTKKINKHTLLPKMKGKDKIIKSTKGLFEEYKEDTDKPVKSESGDTYSSSKESETSNSIINICNDDVETKLKTAFTPKNHINNKKRNMYNKHKKDRKQDSVGELKNGESILIIAADDGEDINKIFKKRYQEYIDPGQHKDISFKTNQKKHKAFITATNTNLEKITKGILRKNIAKADKSFDSSMTSEETAEVVLESKEDNVDEKLTSKTKKNVDNESKSVSQNSNTESVDEDLSKRRKISKSNRIRKRLSSRVHKRDENRHESRVTALNEFSREAQSNRKQRVHKHRKHYRQRIERHHHGSNNHKTHPNFKISQLDLNRHEYNKKCHKKHWVYRKSNDHKTTSNDSDITEPVINTTKVKLESNETVIDNAYKNVVLDYWKKDKNKETNVINITVNKPVIEFSNQSKEFATEVYKEDIEIPHSKEDVMSTVTNKSTDLISNDADYVTETTHINEDLNKTNVRVNKELIFRASKTKLPISENATKFKDIIDIFNKDNVDIKTAFTVNILNTTQNVTTSENSTKHYDFKYNRNTKTNTTEYNKDVKMENKDEEFTNVTKEMKTYVNKTRRSLIKSEKDELKNTDLQLKPFVAKKSRNKQLNSYRHKTSEFKTTSKKDTILDKDVKANKTHNVVDGVSIDGNARESDEQPKKLQPKASFGQQIAKIFINESNILDLDGKKGEDIKDLVANDLKFIFEANQSSTPASTTVTDVLDVLEDALY